MSLLLEVQTSCTFNVRIDDELEKMLVNLTVHSRRLRLHRLYDLLRLDQSRVGRHLQIFEKTATPVALLIWYINLIISPATIPPRKRDR